MSSRFLSLLPLCLAVSLVSGCMVGPDYQKPSAPMSAQFKEAAGWKAAAPRDDQPKGPWWELYQDAPLNALVAQVQISNQNVAFYQAQYLQALALVRQSRADLLPVVSGSLDSTRSKAATSGSSSNSISNSNTATLSASWELDLWGKLRRTVEQDRASAQASQAQLASATLSAQSSLAQDYFQLRVLDQRIELYRQTVQAYEGYLRVIQNKYDEKISSRADLAQAKALLESARASALDLQWQRAQYEHAIALLIGKPPADFALAADKNWGVKIPNIPTGLPSQLLERRPDIAVAERDMAAANAAVGVATAAYYPDLTISASGGWSDLFSVPARFWSVGPSLAGTIFDFGATKAGVDQARAAYDATVATYRQSVLTGLGEVEDYLVELRTLEPEIQAQGRAATAAKDSAEVTLNQYQEGVIDYLDVATTQATSLSQQQSLLSLTGTQLVTSVQLIAALGGGWE
ncbi:MAG: efflux transporter outer membrane subunit [Pseudomonas sp.]|uniref:efflux transporter outer membrane subunit n=1 Tax=Pseudomonas abieticivorans TaxID=2931382 RepID=UPI0020C0225B|nr:efflux transporter outer membrane subunit [Pseudomonas sp. PIA16]MDE1168900.1 efflux transporter outer membrane subunit [Pseudomonas sp.]